MPKSDPEARAEGSPTSFLETLDQLDRGDLVPELDGALTRLVEAVHATGKKGTLRLTLTVDPATKLADMVTVSAAVAEAPPKPPRAGTLFYADEDGRLAREDPRQTRLDLQQAAPPAPQLRKLAANDRD